MYQNVSTVAPFAGLPSTGARPAITSWYSPSVYSMCPFRTAPMLGSARAASSSFWNGRSVGLCHEQWHNHRILTGIVARIVKISGTGSHSALCCQHSACQLLCQPTFFFFLLLFFFFESCTPRPGDRAIGPGKRLRRRARREPRAPVRDPQLRISTRGGKDTGSPQVYFLAQSLKSIPCASGSRVDQDRQRFV